MRGMTALGPCVDRVGSRCKLWYCKRRKGGAADA